MLQKLLLNTVLCSTFCVSAQIIPNNNFENWKSTSEISPENWKTFGAVQKVAGKSSGFSIKLSNNSSTGQLSVMAQMRIDSSIFYKPAFSYAANPDSVTIVYRPLLGTDTAYFKFGFTTTGEEIPVLALEFALGGNSGQWTSATFPIPYTNPTPLLSADSGYAIISSADEVFGPFGSGSIEIDQISFKYTNNNPAPDIPNGALENWHSYAVEHPDAWATTPLFLQKQGFQINESSKTTDAYSGSSGIVLRGITIDNPLTQSIDSLPGQAITLRDPQNPIMSDLDIFSPTFAVSARYSSLRGYVKSDLKGGDRAVAWVNFFSGDSVVGSAIFSDPNNHSNYISFSEDITWDSTFSGIPDSATVLLMLTDSMYFGFSDAQSFAQFDNLSFENWNSSVKKVSTAYKTAVFPNPSNGTIGFRGQVPSGNYTLTITSSNGAEVYTECGETPNGKLIRSLNLSHLQNGIYTLTLISNQEKFNQKLIIIK
ncbi:MAG: T9SS type A sorting domain-containing protein [Bacteroidetes bacterium]|nr:T9SS type A sorting domain-containing protein [Bacteroidota bacterium]